MIAKIFNTSNPMNFLVCSLLTVLAFVVVSVQKYTEGFDFSANISLFLIPFLLVFSLFVIGFIIQKNHINKNDSYAILLFSIFLFLIPEVFSNLSLVVSNTLILLALRKLISLQHLTHSKQKIFDASLLISVASVFEFWLILFLLLVFASIIIHVSRDFKNWLIPFVGVLAVAVLIVLYTLLFDLTIIDNIAEKSVLDFNFGYTTETFYRFSLGIMIVSVIVLLSFQFLSLGNYLATQQNILKKIILFLVLALFIYLFSDKKNNGFLLYSIAPLSIIGSNFINSSQKEWLKDVYIYVFLVLGCISLYLYL